MKKLFLFCMVISAITALMVVILSLIGNDKMIEIINKYAIGLLSFVVLIISSIGWLSRK